MWSHFILSQNWKKCDLIYSLSKLKKIPAWRTWTYRLLPRVAPDSFPREWSNWNKVFPGNLYPSIEYCQEINFFQQIIFKKVMDDHNIFISMHLVYFVWFWSDLRKDLNILALPVASGPLGRVAENLVLIVLCLDNTVALSN